MRAPEGQNLRKTAILNKKFEKRRRSAKTQKKREKGGWRTFSRDRPADFGAGSPQGPPSRARGILDKSSNERIKLQRIELWMRRRWFKQDLDTPWAKARRIFNFHWFSMIFLELSFTSQFSMIFNDFFS